MKLSIGVPAFNQGAFLRETLESILRQTPPFHEIVVSNNHSTDSTADVLAAMDMEHPGRIRVVVPAQHLSMVQNWNFVASHLTGDWFSLLSSDDLVLPGFVQAVEEAAARSPNVTLVRGAWRNIGPAGELIADHHLLSVAALTHVPVTLYEQRFGPKGSFAAFALRRDVWQRVGGFPEQVTLLGDWGMWLLAGALGDIAYTDHVIAAYRGGHQSDSIRRRHHTHMREMLTIYQDLLPRAAALAGLGRPAWIDRASRIRFREAITATSQEYTADERPLLIEAFRPWAQATGQIALFQRFQQGQVLRSFSLMKTIKPLLRSVVTTLRHRSRAQVR